MMNSMVLAVVLLSDSISTKFFLAMVKECKTCSIYYANFRINQKKKLQGICCWKNWIFSDIQNGANASSLVYFMSKAVKANRVDVYYYLRYFSPENFNIRNKFIGFSATG